MMTYISAKEQGFERVKDGSVSLWRIYVGYGHQNGEVKHRSNCLGESHGWCLTYEVSIWRLRFALGHLGQITLFAAIQQDVRALSARKISQRRIELYRRDVAFLASAPEMFSSRDIRLLANSKWKIWGLAYLSRRFALFVRPSWLSASCSCILSFFGLP